MGINLVIAVTDGDWFEMLRGQPNLAEVNFWAPSAANFRALQPGELFLFKLHAPRNVIVGGGVFRTRARCRAHSPGRRFAKRTARVLPTRCALELPDIGGSVRVIEVISRSAAGS